MSTPIPVTSSLHLAHEAAGILTPPPSQPPSSPTSKTTASGTNANDDNSNWTPAVPRQLGDVLRYWDVRGKSCRWALPRLELLLGYAPADISSSVTWWQDRIHTDDRARVLNSVQRFVDDVEARFHTEEYRLLGADGEYVTVIDQLRVLERDPKNGTAIRLVGSLFNPVQRQQVEDILHGSRTDFLRGLQQPRTKNSDNDSAHLLKIVTDNSASGLFMMDRQGHPTFMNQAACDITGWTLNEISHQPLHYSVHNRKPDGSHYPMEECPLDNSAAELVPLKDQHEIFNHRSGRLFPVVFSVAPLSSRGRTVGAVIEFRDVTHERKTEEDKLKLLVQAEAERTKMAASQLSQQKLAQFVDYICHEIRNPLHGISASADFLADCMSKLERELDTSSTNAVVPRAITRATHSLPTSPSPVPSLASTLSSSTEPQLRGEIMRNVLAEVQGYIQSIRECCSHQAAITNNVLDLSRLESGKVELLSDIFDPSEIASKCLAMMSARIAEKKISVHIDLPSVPFLVQGDAMRYSQVIMNLAGNAVKFTGPGKSITIVVSPLEASSDDGDSVVFYTGVRDTGMGMTSEEIASLFVRFGQLNKNISRDYGGSGLGLNISHGLVHLLGGEFNVQSQKGQGTEMRFSVRMQRVGKEAEDAWRGKREAQKKQEEDEVRQQELDASLEHTLSADGESITRDNTPQPLLNATASTLSQPAQSDLSATKKGNQQDQPVAGPSRLPPTIILPPEPEKFSHVLIAEDNHINQMVLATYLKKLGYRHTVCSNGKEAVDRFLAGGVEVIIMDIEMPIMDGREATRVIRAHEDQWDQRADGDPPPSPYIIALSGNARPGLMQDAFDTGLDDYLTKPCTKDELARMLRKWEVHRAKRTANTSSNTVVPSS